MQDKKTVKEIRIEGHAKINLSLDVVGLREDGYHLLETVMQSLALADRLQIRCIYRSAASSAGEVGVKNEAGAPSDKPKGPEINITSDCEAFPAGPANTVYRAGRIFFSGARAREFFDGRRGPLVEALEIHVEKKIPQAAGLGGGSADAAATLLGLNSMWDGLYEEDELLAMGAKIGADVPFCMTGGTAYCTGIGEVIEDLPDFPPSSILLIKPDFGVSTKEAFESLDRIKIKKRPKTKEFLKALRQGGGYEIKDCAGNVFEDLLFKQNSFLADIKDNLASSQGCVYAALSGSGPVVYGVFKDEESAQKAEKTIKNHPLAQKCIIIQTETHKGGPKVTGNLG